MIAQAHAADIIDVEAFSLSEPVEVIKNLHRQGALVILSHHDFHATPENTVMEDLLAKMAALDGDIVKLAVMPSTFGDTLRLIEAADNFRRTYPGMPLVAIAMGKDGALSRITGECFGSCITFASGNASSAPGQLPVAKMKAAIDLIHEITVGEIS